MTDTTYPQTLSTIAVELPDAAYGVSIRPGLLDDIGGILAELTPGKRVGVVTDSNVGPLHLPRLLASLERSGFEAITVTLPAGESHKTLATISQIYDALLSARVERSTPLLALGGGVIGDMTGFAAATILRGVPFIPVPTTLLAMVDASVGGKTGVNHAAGKNLIGAFHHPAAVLIDPSVLKSLPARELRGGLAECIKHDVIRDADGFARLEQSIDRALALDVQYLANLVHHNVVIKASVVEADPYEDNVRAHLNLGHTFGHAIEKVTKFTVSHGEAVALGMVAATHTAWRVSLTSSSTLERVRSLLERVGLPTGRLDADPDALYDAMFSDKKVKAGRLRLVLPECIGRVVIRDDVPESVVREALDVIRK